MLNRRACLLVCPLVYLKNHTAEFYHFFLRNLSVAVAWSVAVRTSGFVDDLIVDAAGI